MSGIVGIYNIDGQPVDPELLRRMTASMAFRGPDAQEIWVNGNVGFGHAMLRATFEQERERQPWSLDGEVWITADARIDGRGDLMRELVAAGQTLAPEPTDVDLILHAYAAWGEACVEHLIGDFAFAIWDGPRQTLFCARDHFGVKPLYYSHLRNAVVISNTLNCVRLHPEVSHDLNELAIADFLVIGENQEIDSTAFAAIRRLPPAHTMVVQDQNVCVVHYWTLPIEDTLQHDRSDDYVAHFRELFWQAVNDRLRTDSVAVFMSGGLDSTSVTGVAKNLLSRQNSKYDLSAYTVVYDKLIPDQERYYSGLAADGIGIPINYLVADEYPLFDKWDRSESYTPEPIDAPLWMVSRDQYGKVARRHRVALTGYGGDPLLYTPKNYFTGLVRHLRFGRLLADVGWHLRTRHRLPTFHFRTWLRRRMGQRPWRMPYPEWVNHELAQRHCLYERWDRAWQEPDFVHPTHPEAYRYLTSRAWPSILTCDDASFTGVPVDVRHPFFDLRLVRYVLRCPSFPWCEDKYILRESMNGVLPERIRIRPKTPLAGDPSGEIFKQAGVSESLRAVAAEKLAGFVDFQKIQHQAALLSPDTVWNTLRVYGLAAWLHGFLKFQA